jgi:type VI secretion system protein ImpG
VTFNKYFQDELTYLREMGREFANTYPALAPMLADRGGDPDVERLLEGFAFLSGRVREKLDDELPELMLTVSQMLFPQMVRPLPATTILEFLPLPNALRESRTVPVGTEVQSVPIDGTQCRFRTTRACTLSPLAIDRVSLQDLPAGKQEVQLDLLLTQSGELERLLPDKLSLHLAGEPRDSLGLLSNLAQFTEEIVLCDPDRGTGPEVHLPGQMLTLPGFSQEESLLPHVETSFPGFRLLQEYYTLPAKFAFVDIAGMRRAQELGELKRLGVRIRLRHRANELRRISESDIRLHCTPVVNVFQTTAEPIRLSSRRERYVVRPAGLPPGQGDIYEIERVQSVMRGGQRVEIPPFLSFEHAGSLEDRSRIFYTEHRRSTVVGNGTDIYISLGTAEDSSVTIDSEVLSLDIKATNGPLANAIRAGELTEATASSPPYAKFRNLSAVTTYVPPVLGHDLMWRATAHTAMNLRALTELDVLRSTLGVYNLQARVDRQIARANELRIEALRGVSVEPAERLYRGAVIRGVQIEVEVDESGFSGEGDMYLFGAVLDRIFAEYVSINSFSRTKVRGITSNVRFEWPARSGNLTLL